MSDIASALVLGLVEGLTEFIPVSSTGHLILVGELLGFQEPGEHFFEVFIQLGAILAVVVLYHRRFLELFDFRPGRPGGFAGWEGMMKVFVACVPALVAGFLLHDAIKEYLFSSLTVAIALIAWGVVMVAIERRPREPSIRSFSDVSLAACLGVGLFQCLALWPGVSRSGSTIVGAMILGFDRKIAAEFSFFIAVPVMGAAVGYDLLKNLSSLDLEAMKLLAVGFVVSFVTGFLAIRIFMRLLQRFSLAAFGWYRIAVGLVVLALVAW